MIFNGPNPDKAEISNLFDEFLTCSQPLTDSISGWSPQSPESSSSISPSLSPEASPPPEPFPFITGIHSRISIPQPFKPTVPKRKIVQTEQPLKRTAAKKAKKEPAVPLVPPEGASEADIDMCKKARRRKQNRDAAQTSREKKKRYLQGLEQQVCDLKKENQRLMELLEASQRENRVLKGEPADPPAAAGGSMFLPPLDPSAATPTLQEAKPEQPIVKKETPVATEKAKMNITVKTEPSTTFESAVFSLPQQPEVVLCLVTLFPILLLLLLALESTVRLASMEMQSSPPSSPQYRQAPHASPCPSPPRQPSIYRTSSSTCPPSPSRAMKPPSAEVQQCRLPTKFRSGSHLFSDHMTRPPPLVPIHLSLVAGAA